MEEFNSKWDNLDHMLEVTICGSMKQRDLFPFAERLLVERFRNKGVIVNQPVLYYEDDYARSLVHPDIKKHLHEEKIIMSDFVLVVDGLFHDTAYFEKSTQAEIMTAQKYNVPVFYLSDLLIVDFDNVNT